MRVAIIGRGIIGQTLAKKLSASGVEVVFGVRSAPHASNELPIPEALDGVDVVVVAIPGDQVERFAQSNAAALAGHLVIDAANNVGGPTLNAAQAIADHVPTARYARAFNTLGWENFDDPNFGEEIADLFYAAPDEDRETVDSLIAAVGLRPIHLGGSEAIPVVDSLVGLWFTLMRRRNNRAIAFRMLER